MIGAMLCRGSRRISRILRVMGLSNTALFSKYHRVLSRANWNGLELAKILLGLLVQLLPASRPIIIGVCQESCRLKLFFCIWLINRTLLRVD